MNGQEQRKQATRETKAAWAQAEAEGRETTLAERWMVERPRKLPDRGGGF